jgi:hypothetical protein
VPLEEYDKLPLILVMFCNGGESQPQSGFEFDLWQLMAKAIDARINEK